MNKTHFDHEICCTLPHSLYHKKKESVLCIIAKASSLILNESARNRTRQRTATADLERIDTTILCTYYLFSELMYFRVFLSIRVGSYFLKSSSFVQYSQYCIKFYAILSNIAQNLRFQKTSLTLFVELT